MLEHEDWQGTTSGTTWMHKTLISMFKHVDVRLFYVVVALFVAPLYMVFHHQGYLAIYHYLRRRQGYSSWRAFAFTYLNHYRFGQIILDRFAAYAGVRFHCEVEGNDQYLSLANGDDGFVILSCHVGNYEMAGYLFQATAKPYNALVFPGEAATVMEQRRRILAKNNIRMIPVSDDMTHVFKMSSALADGEIVSIPGDRIFGSPRYVECQFFGRGAHFPLGPYALAVQRDVPVLAIFVMKVGAYRYQAYVRRIENRDNALKRNDRAAALAQQFANELEAVLRDHPEQWFNYYEFWDDHR